VKLIWALGSTRAKGVGKSLAMMVTALGAPAPASCSWMAQLKPVTPALRHGGVSFAGLLLEDHMAIRGGGGSEPYYYNLGGHVMVYKTVGAMYDARTDACVCASKEGVYMVRSRSSSSLNSIDDKLPGKVYTSISHISLALCCVSRA
jgi:hypothetical protein